MHHFEFRFAIVLNIVFNFTKNHLKSRNFGWFTFLQKSLKSDFSNEILMSCIFSIVRFYLTCSLYRDIRYAPKKCPTLG